MNSHDQTFDDYVIWARRVSSHEPMELPLYEADACLAFLRGWVGACGEAPRLIDALGPVADQFVRVAQYALCDILWRDDLSLALCERAVTGSVPMLQSLCERTSQPLVPRMFWMVVLEYWDVVLRKDATHRLLPTVKSTLLEQLRSAKGASCLRGSAWEGIRLIDEDLARDAHAIEAQFQGSVE